MVTLYHLSLTQTGVLTHDDDPFIGDGVHLTKEEVEAHDFYADYLHDVANGHEFVNKEGKPDLPKSYIEVIKGAYHDL